MNPRKSYFLGLSIVVGVVLASTAVILGYELLHTPELPKRFGLDLGDSGYPLDRFRLIERSGKVVTEADLANEVWVSAFIFTRCPISCPRISSVMKGLQKPLGKLGVKLVSISVDPDYDTPAVLTKYANGLEADPNGWWFLTGKQDEIVDLVHDRFHLTMMKIGEPSAKSKLEEILHSPKLALVDRGNTVVGFFDSNDPGDLKQLLAKAKWRAAPPWARKLPAVNATLNGSCAVLLTIGWFLILGKQVRAHAAVMISAVSVSAAFLGCYLVYHYLVGSVEYPGTGWSKIIYRSILLSHTILATLGVVPLVSMTLIYAIRKRFDRHAPLARVTFPIWLYVSITGVVIYWMLYQMPVTTSSSL